MLSCSCTLCLQSLLLNHYLLFFFFAVCLLVVLIWDNISLKGKALGIKENLWMKDLLKGAGYTRGDTLRDVIYLGGTY